MTCRECLETVRARPEEPAETLPQEARDHLASCPRCRARLAALRLIESGQALRVQPPPGLDRSISSWRFPQAERARSKRPRLAWVPLAAAALVAVVLGSFLAGYLAGGRGTTRDLVEVHLSLAAPAAREVAVVGDWNGWNPKAQLMKRQDGKWEIVLELQRGRSYQYQFLIDGKVWIPDPNNLVKVDNGFGGQNSLIGS